MVPFSEDGFPRERCLGCGWVHYHNPRATASAIIPRNGKILLCQRAAGPFKGQWDLPGGFLEEKESAEDGLRREMQEELGISTEIVRFVGVFAPVHYPFGGQDHYNVDLYWEVKISSGEPQAVRESDVAKIDWFDPENLPPMAFPSNVAGIRVWKKMPRSPKGASFVNPV